MRTSVRIPSSLRRALAPALLALASTTASAQDPSAPTPETSDPYPLPSTELVAPASDQGHSAEKLEPLEDAEELLASALRLVRSGGGEGLELARQKLERHRAALLPHMLEALLEPGRLSDEEGPLFDARARALLFELVAESPSGELVERVRTSIDEFSSLSKRLRALEVIGACADAEALDTLLELALEIDPVSLQHRTCAEQLETAIARILERDDRAYYVLRARVRDLGRPMQHAAARAVGRSGLGPGLSVLERMLGNDPRLDAVAIEAVGKLRPWERACRNGAAARVLSPFLGSREPEVRRAAALAMAWHGGANEVGELVNLLEDLEPRVAAAALSSLRHISGHQSSGDALRWSDWYAREVEWFEREGEELCALARDLDAGPAFGALRKLSAHRLFRTELVLMIESTPTHPVEDIALAACGALGRLGGGEAVHALSGALSDGRPEVKAAAAAALRAATGGRPFSS